MVRSPPESAVGHGNGRRSAITDRCLDPMRKRNSFVAVLGLALPGLLLPVACNSRSKGAEASASEIPSATVAAVQRGSIAHVLSLAAQFQPYQVVDVHPKVSGFMQKINVDI